MRFSRLTVIAVIAAGLLAGCGATGSAGNSSSGTASSPPSQGAGNAEAFAWLRPAPPPVAWSLARLGTTVTLAYPPGWHPVKSDAGTVSAGRVDTRSGLIAQYLNATPQQADETLQNWSAFRPAHNREEGDSHVLVLAAGQGLRFRDGTGSCVIDRYRTSKTTYQEIACLVRGPAGGTVVVAAGLSARWAQDAPALERAVSAFMA
jgi:hypothetical protein